LSAGEARGWEELAPDLSRSLEWAHPGIAADALGHLYWAHPAGGRIVVQHLPSGGVASIAVPLLEIHDIATTSRSAGLRLWLADPGFKMRPPDYEPEARRGAAGVFDLATGRFEPFPVPDHPAYAEDAWRPTSIAVDEGEELVVVADGYGQSLVHLFRDGTTRTVDGTATGTRFACPHGLAIIDGPTGQEIVVVDRGNRRLVMLDADGEPLRILEDDRFRQPSGVAVAGDHLIVTDLQGALFRVGVHDEHVELIVPFVGDPTAPGWPNRETATGLHRPELAPDRLHSPHGIVALQDGSVALTEWLIGGRVLRLAGMADVSASDDREERGMNDAPTAEVTR
jgi:hypothetical protein